MHLSRAHEPGKAELSIGPERTACRGAADSSAVLPSSVSCTKCGIQSTVLIVDAVSLFCVYLSHLERNVTHFKNLHSKVSLRCLIQYERSTGGHVITFTGPISRLVLSIHQHLITVLLN